MEQRAAKKKLGGGAKALIVILVILVILIGLPLLYLSIGFPHETLEALAATTPMPSSERYAFHAWDRSVDITLDNSDVGWLLSSHDELADVLAEVEQTLAPYGLTLKDFSARFENGVALVSAKLLWKGVVPLPLQAHLDVGSEGRNITATLKSVDLGRLIHLDADTLPLPRDARTFSLDGGDIHSRLEQLNSARIEGDRLVLNCGVGRELVKEVLANLGAVESVSDYLGENEALTVARGFLDAVNPDYGPFDTLLKECEKDPAYFVSFKLSELVVAEDFKANLYLTNSESKMLARFLPEVSQESVAVLDATFDAEIESRKGQLLTVARALQSLNEARELSSDGKQFINLESGGAPLTLDQLGGGELASWIIPESIRFVYGKNPSEYMTFRLEGIAKMPKEASDAFAGMSGKLSYPPVLMLRLPNERPALAFDPTGKGLQLRYLDEETYLALLSSVRIPVADLGAAGMQ